VKAVAIHDASLEDCVKRAQREGVVLTRNGKPVAVLLGVQGLDWEQLELGYSDEFWSLIRLRRGQRTVSRAELETRLEKPRRNKSRAPRKER
jgi:prevent-host-death family protein